MTVTRALSRPAATSTQGVGAPEAPRASAPPAASTSLAEAAVSKAPVDADIVRGARAAAVGQEAAIRDQFLNATPTPGSNKGWVIVKR